MTDKPGDYEKKIKRLQYIVSQLEGGDIPLEKAAALYKEGVQTVHACRKRLEQAKNEVSVFLNGKTEDFEPESQDEPGPEE